MDHHIKHSSWSITHKAIPHILWTLLISQMNMRPGGKQAKMQDGWYVLHGEQIMQSMCFLAGHSEFPGQPKGMCQVLIEQGLWMNGLVTAGYAVQEG
jgi:hypothetical protein